MSILNYRNEKIEFRIELTLKLDKFKKTLIFLNYIWTLLFPLGVGMQGRLQEQLPEVNFLKNLAREDIINLAAWIMVAPSEVIPLSMGYVSLLSFLSFATNIDLLNQYGLTFLGGLIIYSYIHTINDPTHQLLHRKNLTSKWLNKCYESLTNQRKLTALEKLDNVGFPDHLLPVDFRCDILHTVMTTPVCIGSAPQKYDLDNLLTYLNSSPDLMIGFQFTNNQPTFQFRNPATQQLVKFPDDVHTQDYLKADIDRFIILVSEGITIAKKARGFTLFQHQLSDETLRTIRDRALEAIKNIHKPQGLVIKR